MARIIFGNSLIDGLPGNVGNGYPDSRYEPVLSKNVNKYYMKKKFRPTFKQTTTPILLRIMNPFCPIFVVFGNSNLIMARNRHLCYVPQRSSYLDR